MVNTITEKLQEIHYSGTVYLNTNNDLVPYYVEFKIIGIYKSNSESIYEYQNELYAYNHGIMYLNSEASNTTIRTYTYDSNKKAFFNFNKEGGVTYNHLTNGTYHYNIQNTHEGYFGPTFMDGDGHEYPPGIAMTSPGVTRYTFSITNTYNWYDLKITVTGRTNNIFLSTDTFNFSMFYQDISDRSTNPDPPATIDTIPVNYTFSTFYIYTFVDEVSLPADEITTYNYSSNGYYFNDEKFLTHLKQYPTSKYSIRVNTAEDNYDLIMGSTPFNVYIVIFNTSSLSASSVYYQQTYTGTCTMTNTYWSGHESDIILTSQDGNSGSCTSSDGITFTKTFTNNLLNTKINCTATFSSAKFTDVAIITNSIVLYPVNNLSIVTSPAICGVKIIFKWDQIDTTSRNIYIGNTGNTISGSSNVANYTPTNDDFLSRYPTTTDEPVSLNSYLYGTDTTDSWLTYSISLIPFSINPISDDILIGTTSTITWQGYAGNYSIQFKNTTVPAIDITCTGVTGATGNSFTWTVPLSYHDILITPGTYQYVVTAIFDESRTYTQSIDVTVTSENKIYILNGTTPYLSNPFISTDYVNIAWNFDYTGNVGIYQWKDDISISASFLFLSPNTSKPYYYTLTDFNEKLTRWYDCTYMFKVKDSSGADVYSDEFKLYTSEIIIDLDTVETIGYNSNYNLTWTSTGPTDIKNGRYYGTELIDIYIDDTITTAVNISASSGTYTFNPTVLGLTASSIDIKLVYDNYHFSNTITVSLVDNTVTLTITTGAYSYDLYRLNITFTPLYNVQDTFTITLLKEDITGAYITDHTIGTAIFSTDTHYDWYPYSTFATNKSIIDPHTNYKIKIQSANLNSLNATSDSFQINPNCLIVTANGDYTVLSIIDIVWTTIPTVLPTVNPYSLTTDNFKIYLSKTGTNIPIVSPENTPYEWTVSDTSLDLVDTYTLHVESNKYSIYGSCDITFTENTVTLTVSPGTYSYDLYRLNIIFNVEPDIRVTFIVTLLEKGEPIHTIGTDIFFDNNIYDWYPYLNFKNINPDSQYTIQIQSNVLENLNSTSDPFTINPNCLSVIPDGGFYTVLSQIKINWYTVSVPLPTNQSHYSLSGDNFNIHLINTNLDIQIVSPTNTPYLWKVANTSQSLLGTYTLLVQSNLYSIYGSYDITFIQPSQEDYGLLENKKLGIAPCSSISLTPALARATTNTICITNKKNNVPMTTIKLGGRTFLVPCGIVKYLPELKSLLATMTLREALLFLIQKYNIEIPSKQLVNKKRYQYPTADAKITYPILQFNTSFRLAGSTVGIAINRNPKFSERLGESRILGVCNDDTKTFSYLYTDMLKNATFWLTSLPSFQDFGYIYCIIRQTNAGLKKVITGSITLIGNTLVFTPIILKELLFFYQPYPENTDITILYHNSDVSTVLTYVQEKYFQDSVVINSSCL